MSSEVPESNLFPYQDVLNRGYPDHPWNDPFRLKHPSMEPGRRAKLFAPFDALKGFSEAIAAEENFPAVLLSRIPGQKRRAEFLTFRRMNMNKGGTRMDQTLPESEKRQLRCCFTGHRPQKLTRPVDDIKIDLENEILRAVREGYKVFITGMAQGTDIWAGNIVARLKESDPSLKLIAALPFPGFTARWEENWLLKYDRLLARADYVHTVLPAYSPQAWQFRNMWMVDRSSRVIAVFNGESGGTENTVAYAASRGIDIRKIKG